jgi:hypothetical protein
LLCTTNESRPTRSPDGRRERDSRTLTNATGRCATKTRIGGTSLTPRVSGWCIDNGTGPRRAPTT